MGVAIQAVSALRRIAIVILIAIAFLFGLATTVYLSLRSPEVRVPEVVGKDRFEAEKILNEAGLNFRVRATRPSNQVRADTVLFQLPRAGDVVKAGQTVAMDISRAAKEGEASAASVTDKKAAEEKASENRDTDEPASPKNANANRSKRNRNTNKDANENSNASGNTNEETRNSNTNKVGANANTSTNANRTGDNGNAKATRNATQNENRRPPSPRPSPATPQY